MNTTSPTPRFYRTRPTTQLRPLVHGECHREHRRLVAAITHADHDVPVARFALQALSDVRLLFDAAFATGGLTDIAAEALDVRLAVIEKSLRTFLP